MDTFRFTAELWEWRGPSPYHFLTVPDGISEALRPLAAEVSYGWGMIPVWIRIGGGEWPTSLFPKDGRYVVPVKDAIRRRASLAPGDEVDLELWIRA